MRVLLTVLGVVALVIVVAGAVNRAVGLRVDYLVGTTTPVSLFWFALATAVLLVGAGLLGVLVGRSSAAGGRRKLEAELEDTYQRLRGAQAAVLARGAEAPAAARAETELRTAVQTEPDETRIAAVPTEPVTVVEPTGLGPGAAVEPAGAGTVVEPAGSEPQTAVTTAPDEPDTVVARAPDEPGAEAEPAPEGPAPEERAPQA